MSHLDIENGFTSFHLSVPRGAGQRPTVHELVLAGMRRILSRLNGSQFTRNMGAGSAMALFGSLLSIISYPLYLHYLGYHRYGLWLALSVVVSVAQLGNLGIPWALTNLVAEDHGRGDWEGVRIYVNSGCGIILGIGLFFFSLVMLFRSSILRSFNLTNSDAATAYSLLPYVATLSVLVLLFSTLNATLGGLGRMDLTSYNETITQVLIIIFSVIFLRFGLDVRGMVMGTMLAYAVAHLLALFHLRRLVPITLFSQLRIDPQRLGRMLHTGGWLLGAGICNTLLTPITRLMLSRYAGLEAITINDMCFTGSMRVRGVFDSAFRPIMPDIRSFGSARKDFLKDRVRSIDRKSFAIIFGAALPTFILLFLIITPLLHAWLHRSFNNALPGTFRIAFAAAFVSLLGTPAYYILIGLGRPRDVAFSAAIQVTVNAIVLVLLARAGHLTVETAALSFGVAAVCTTVFLRILIVMNRGSKELILANSPTSVDPDAL